MCRLVAFIVAATALLPGNLAAQTAPAGEGQSTLIYSPWMKLCLKDQEGRRTCFITRGARTECGVSVGEATVIERDGQTTKTLRVALPTNVAPRSRVRIIIDQEQP